ncbi:MAG TPA: hypothetical protein ENN80_09510 [Candidatus Hydrogenedentes bacterium]|nr:hypothetical protein [Candidatus Hydrogenedentota bacterium]
MRYRYVVFAITALAVALVGCPPPGGPHWYWQWGNAPGVGSYDEGPITETRDLESGARLDVSNDIGEVRVSGWNRDEVSITYTKTVDMFQWNTGTLQPAQHYLDGIDIDVTVQAGGITVETAIDETVYNFSGFDRYDVAAKNRRGAAGVVPRVRYDIRVPKQLRLGVLQNVGDVRVQGVGGKLRVDLDVGDIEIVYPGEPEPQDRIECTMSVGDVDILLPAGSSFAVDASVDIGNIRAGDFPTLDVRRYGWTGAWCHDSVGSGGADIVVNIDVGDFTLSAY